MSGFNEYHKYSTMKEYNLKLLFNYQVQGITPKESTINNVMYELMALGFDCRYIENPKRLINSVCFRFPDVTITGEEIQFFITRYDLKVSVGDVRRLIND